MGKGLSLYGARQAASGASVQRSTRRTRRIKRFIMGAVALLVVSMIIWPLTNVGKRSFKVNLASKTTQAGDEKPQMLKPRLHGMDEQGQPYNVTASEAIQEDAENVIMQDVSGDIFLKDNGWINVSSDTGHYHVEAQRLDLLGAVMMLTDTGYELNTEMAYVRLKKKEINGDVRVELQGPLGTLAADSFRVEGNADIFTFAGNVHLVVYPKAGKKK